MKTVLFIHRSVGHNLIHDGSVYDLLKRRKTPFTFNDYDQNTDTLTDADGQQQAPGFTFPGGNTRPADYAEIFSEEVAPHYQPIQDKALAHDIIIIKSCYPNSNIASDNELAAIKDHYQSIAAFFALRKDKQLIILTSPPLVPLLTKKGHADRARQLATWLQNETLATNVSVFNFFDLLAAPDQGRGANMLRRTYRRWLPVDSHPNAKASREIAPKFIDYLSSVKQ